MMRQSISFGLSLIVSLGTPLAAQLPDVPQPTKLYTGPTSAADSLNLTIAIYRAATAQGTSTALPAPLPRLVCLGRFGAWNADPPAGVLTALQQIDTLLVRPISACRHQPAPRRTPTLTDTLTGRRGIAVWASEPRFARGDGSFEVDLGYGEHGLSAAVWKCTGRKRDGRWEVSACIVTMSA
jgi:hypothetical protein